ncbi:MAG: DUF309 domain-containing protein [bacterium]|nr:DUF309 domain-containing protein [bacterium]
MSLQSARAHIFEFEALIRAGRYFEAHEAMEEVWIARGRRRGDLWQALTQLAVAITHASRGNHRGAERVLRKAESKLSAGLAEYDLPEDALQFALESYESEFTRTGRSESE